MFRSKLVLASIIAVFLLCSQVEAGTSYWDACGEGGWGDPCNWSPIGVPNDITFDVVINCPNGVEVRLTDNYTINKLDCYGQVDLESWDGWHRLTLNHADGLKNFGYLEIEEIGIIGNVTNWAMLELCDMDIEGDLNNLSGAWMGVEYEAWVEGTLQNGGTIEIDLMSELVVDGVFWNYSSGTILIYGGECGADEQMLYNYGVIRGVGVLYGGQDVQNLDQGQIIASGGSLVVSCEGSLINTSTGLLRNEPLASLQIKPWLHRLHTEPEDVNNYGRIEVNAGGGVAFDCNLVNEANGIIRLLGGTLAARNITHSAGAMLYGFGTITTNELLLESGTDPELTGPTNIVGNLKVANGATLIISAGLTLITGHTMNNGTILLDGGSVIFEGGYSGSGEVSVPPGDNVALNKAASQSSTAYGGVPSRAVDGTTDGVWANSSVTCTNSNLNAWWQVDLGTTCDISAIEVWNRTDSAVDRLDDFYVFVSDAPFASTDLATTLSESGVWNRQVDVIPNPEVLFPVNQAGRYMRIQLGDTNYLSLAEVKVFGEVFVPTGNNIALGKTITQSSTAYGGAVSRAIDDNTDGVWANSSVTCTNSESNAWLQMDLGTTYDISAIEVWNRTDSAVDRLDDFYVIVSDTPFASTDLTATLNQSGVWSRHMIAAPTPAILFTVGQTGRYVRIQLGGSNYLSLAELKIFGEVFVP